MDPTDSHSRQRPTDSVPLAKAIPRTDAQRLHGPVLSWPALSWPVLSWPLLSVAQSRDVDRVAIEQFGMEGIELMRNAGAACATRLLDEFAGNPRLTIVLAGSGNNGGDGYVIARHLHTAGCPVRVFSLAPIDKLSGDALQSYQDAVAAKVDTAVADRVETIRQIEFDDALIVDCLLGTGARGRPRSPFAEGIEIVNSLPRKSPQRINRVAIDVPSGFDGDTGQASEATFLADLTLTFVAPKTAMGQPESRRYTGEIEIVDIGIPDLLKRRLGIPTGAEGQG